MAYNEHLEERISANFKQRKVDFITKKMFGGLCYMVDDKMCLGVMGDQLMARVGPYRYDDALTREGVSRMEFTGRPLKGYVYVGLEAIDMDDDLDEWIQLCLDFNPLAKASKKRKKKG